jgi:hypothetical protein
MHIAREICFKSAELKQDLQVDRMCGYVVLMKKLELLCCF